MPPPSIGWPNASELVARDARHRAEAHRRHVAADELHADRAAVDELRRRVRRGLPTRLRRRPAPVEAPSARADRSRASSPGRHPAEEDGVDARERPIPCGRASARPRLRGDLLRVLAEVVALGRARVHARCAPGARAAPAGAPRRLALRLPLRARHRERRAEPGTIAFGIGRASSSSMLLIGVTPAMAPSRRSSRRRRRRSSCRSGRSGCRSSRRRRAPRLEARVVRRLDQDEVLVGPEVVRVEMISTSNFSGVVPEKTVRP
jgi:hypothetical protein